MRGAVRLPLLTLVVLLAACPATRDVGSAPADDDGVLGPQPRCTGDADCALAAATCCECPAFAVDRADPTLTACSGVQCPNDGTTCADNVRAACEAGQCTLACVALACAESCPGGFAMDPTGCLACACAAADPGGCTRDADCVETRAACCGCAQGGADTAVLATEQASFDASLGCGPSPTCPAVDVCEPGAAPRCLQGRCELSSAGGLPPGACGRPDLPACPAGTVCLINADDLASQQGVGVCGQP